VKPLTIGKEYWELPTGTAEVTEYMPLIWRGGRLLHDKMWEEYEFCKDWSRVNTSATRRGLEISQLFALH